MSAPLSSTLGMTALVFGIVRSADAGWSDATHLARWSPPACCCSPCFVVNERRAPQPIMPLRLFADRQRSGAYAARLLFLGAMAPFWFFTTQLLQSVAGYSAGRKPASRSCPRRSPNFAAAMAIPQLTRRYGNPTRAGRRSGDLASSAWPG